MLQVRVWQPSEGLSSRVSSVFWFEGPTAPTDLILPDVGAADLVVQLGGQATIDDGARAFSSPRAYLVGASDRAFVARNADHINTVGIRLSTGCACALGVSAASVRNVVAPISDLSPRLSRVLECWAEDFVQRRTSVRDLVALLDAPACRCDELAVAAARLFTARGVSVEGVGRQLDVSRRQLTRRFTSAIGTTPRIFRRVARFARVCQRVSVEPPRSWAGLALDAGYCDQSHLVRDFHALAHGAPLEVFSLDWYSSFTLDQRTAA